jgi:hypothetical protein
MMAQVYAVFSYGGLFSLVEVDVSVMPSKSFSHIPSV